MVAEDLFSSPTDKQIVVDLFCEYPTWELRQLTKMNRAIFLVSTDAFRREEEQRRYRKGNSLADLLKDYPDPMRIIETGYGEALRRLSSYVRKECKNHNLPMVTTGGNLSADETYNAVCKNSALLNPRYSNKHPIVLQFIRKPTHSRRRLGIYAHACPVDSDSQWSALAEGASKGI